MVNLLCDAIIPDGPMKEVDEIEDSLRTKYKKSILSKFLKAINDFDLVQDGDKIAIGVSGGKDSLLLVKLFLHKAYLLALFQSHHQNDALMSIY